MVVTGAGFAGTYAAIAASRLLHEHVAARDQAEVVLVAPEPRLALRPRLYEDDPGAKWVDLAPLLNATEVRFLAAYVDRIDAAGRRLHLRGDAPDLPGTLHFDSLVLAAGGRALSPDVPGLSAHAFSVDQIAAAEELWRHMHRLATLPPSIERDTVIIVGGGFTGIETAAEMPRRLRAVLGDAACPRVVIVEQADAIGPDLGPGPRPVIETALRELGIECMLGQRVTAIDAAGVVLASGTRIPGATVVWTGGQQATTLTIDIPGPRDAAGRLEVGRDLKSPSCEGVFVAGDAAKAPTDDAGNFTLMSCQHAMSLGRIAGHNAAAHLLGVPLVDYRQERYVTCLDLGEWGALLSHGWERTVVGAGPSIKQLKRDINGSAIYPPPPDRELAFAAAAPDIASVA